MSTRFRLTALLALLALNACTTASAEPARDLPTAELQVPRSDVRAKLAKHREEQIERLHAYAEAGAFPHNYASRVPLHMFKDADGRLCAVANLVQKDGLADLVNATARDHNDVALADVKGGPLNEWAIASGLTIEEIARIQRPAPMIRRPVPPQATNSALPAARKPNVQKPAVVNQVADEEGMRREVRAHFATVEAELRAATERSLEVAVARWLAARS